MLTPAPKDHVFSAIWPTNPFLWFGHKIYVKTKDSVEGLFGVVVPKCGKTWI